MDGVIAPMSGANQSLLPLHWGGFNPSVLYNPEVVGRIAAWHGLGLVECQWLTSWQDEANPCFTRIGLGPYVTHIHREDTPDHWWKALVVERALTREPHRAVVWLDDELLTRFSLNVGTVEWRLEDYSPRLLALAPDSWTGLTTVDLDRIEAYLLSAEQNR